MFTIQLRSTTLSLGNRQSFAEVLCYVRRVGDVANNYLSPLSSAILAEAVKDDISILEDPCTPSIVAVTITARGTVALTSVDSVKLLPSAGTEAASEDWFGSSSEVSKTTRC